MKKETIKKLLVTIAVITFVNTLNAEGKTLKVPEDYNSISKAVENAAEGDRIYIAAGVYDGPVEIRKNVSLEGEDCNRVILKGSSDFYIITATDCSSGKIANITVRQEGPAKANTHCAGIWLKNSSMRVENCRVEDCNSYGIYVSHLSRAVISNCRFYRNAWGGAGVFDTGTFAEVTGCIFENNQHDALKADDGASITARDNLIRGSRVGIAICNRKRESCTKSSGELTGNKISNCYGYAIYSEDSDLAAKKNECRESGGGISANNSGRIITMALKTEITDNVLEGIGHTAVHAKADNAVIKGNSCSKSKNGIYVEDSNGPVIEGNKCNSNKERGIVLYKGQGAVVNGNECGGNGNSGIQISQTKGKEVRVKGNRCLDNPYYGITFFSGSDVQITQNECQGNNFGIYCEETNKVSICENTCSKNAGSGISVNSSIEISIVSNMCTGNKYNGIQVKAEKSRTAVRQNVCCSNEYRGIDVIDANKAWVEENICQYNYRGIEYSSQAGAGEILKNDCRDNYHSGIAVFNGEAKLGGNTAVNNGWAGILVRMNAKNCTISGNRLEKNAWGAVVYSSSKGIKVEPDNTFVKNGKGQVKRI